MAIKIPIISEFANKGFKALYAEFKKTEGAANKFKFAMKQAMSPAGLAAIGTSIAGIGYAALDMAKAAAEDSRQQAILAKTLQNVTGASDATIASTEKLITAMQMQYGVADSDLRVALGNLVRGTGDLTQAQDLLTVSLDIAKATGKDFVSTSLAMGKAAAGSFTALKKLGIPLDEGAVKAKNFDAIVQQLSATFGGAAQANADTLAGKLDIVNQRLSEAKEKIGAQLTPALADLAEATSGTLSALDKLGNGVNWIGGQFTELAQATTDLVHSLPGMGDTFDELKAKVLAEAQATVDAGYSTKLLKNEFLGLWDAINYGKKPLSWLVTSGLPNLNSYLNALGYDTTIKATEGVSSFGGAVEETISPMQKWLATAKEMQTSLATTVRGFLNLGDAAKEKNVKGFVGSVTGQAKIIKDYAKNLMRLQDEGLSAAAIQGIMGLDLVTGAGLAQDLANHPMNFVKQLNRAYASVNATATQFGQSMGAFLGTGGGAPVTQYITITNPNPRAVVQQLREYGRNAGPLPIAVTGSF